MRLNLQTDYALRLLMHLAVNGDALSTIATVADRYGISKNHLMKVANILGRKGIVETVRGRTGGLRLARSSDEIVLGDIVRLMEADLAVVECFQGAGGDCLITPACRLKAVLSEALNAFLSVLDDYTLTDLVRKNTKLQKLLSLEAA